MVDGASPIRLLQVPFDSGLRDARMGAGPSATARAGAADRLRALGHAVHVQEVEPDAGWRAELRTAFELQRAVARAVAAARDAGQVPILLSGNCNATLGVLAGLARPGLRVGLVWLDAHGDFNTPDTDPSGFLDGHGLAMVVGRCWRAMTAQVAGFEPLPERRVLLVGTRSLDDAERQALTGSEVAWLTPAQARDPGAVTEALRVLAGRVDVLHLHVDLDVYDPSIAPANGYAVPDGLLAHHVRAVVGQAAACSRIVSATLASYDPALDPAGRMQATVLDLLEQLAGAARPCR